MKRKPGLLLALLVLVIAVSAVFAVRAIGSVHTGPHHSNVKLADASGATDAGQAEIVKASNQLGAEIYQALAAAPGNVFLSPYSISTTVAMAYEGAAGQTATEMQSVLHVSADVQVRQPAFAAVYNGLNPRDAGYELRVANALWAQQDYPFAPSYVSLLQSRYAAEAANIDFATAAEPARQRINQWVANKTEQKIKDLLPPGSIKEVTRLVLTDAVYFKGSWLTPFKPGQTKDADFHLSSGEAVRVPMMHLDDEDFEYGEADEYQALEMHYANSKLSMLVLLPKAGVDLHVIEKSLSADWFDKVSQNMYRRSVEVFIPRFTFTSSYRLNDTLSTLGMPTAFDPDKADFSGMTGKQGLYIGTVVHKAFVSVDEKGTEAAAATGLTVDAASSEVGGPAVFRADHPFLFAVRDWDSGLVVFLGRVADPTKAE